MCGICGCINFKDQIKKDSNIHSMVESMNDALSHRGPDNSGFYSDKNISFGHRRLSIVDLTEDSNQPMTDDLDNVVIVFNGEIYNSSELRKELEKDYSFKTDHSDTETIIYAYKKWGVDCVKKFSGMFALAIYDKEKKCCYLFRDRLGKKPLYYTKQNNNLFFSSEVQSFFKAKILEKEIREESLYHYLSLLTVPAPNTFFENIEKLELGHYLKIDKDSSYTIHKYWDISDFINKTSDISLSDATVGFEKLLERSMKLRNVSDVPVSIALSGGLDSSLNLFYSDKISKKKIQCINISYEETSKFDESVIAEKFSKEIGADFYPKKITSTDFETWLDDYLSIQKDSPCGDVNTSMVYGLSLLSRKNKGIVMLVGEGGDELGGYPIYKKLLKYQNYLDKIPLFLWNFISFFSKKVKDEVDIYKRAKDYSIRRFIFGFKEHEKKKFWLKDVKSNSYDEVLKYTNQITTSSNDVFYKKILNAEYKLRLSELILPRIDYPSMAASIEARAPFMDHDLIEFTASLPFDLKMNKTPKSIIKSIAKKHLPNYITNAPKVGFGQLLTPFFNSTLPDWYKTEIIDTDSPIKHFISSEFLESIHSNKDYSYRMWLVYSLNKWLTYNLDAKNFN
jgi:asparagine synthase (glutamine-hydrolysing)